MKRASILAMAMCLASPFLALADPVAPPNWSSPQQLTKNLILAIPSHPESGSPNAYMDNQGIVHAVWSESKNAMVKAKLARYELEWSTPMTISDFKIGGQGPIAALNAYGKGSIPFVQYAHSPQEIYARGVGGQFCDLVQVSNTQTFAMNAATDGAGNTLIAWVNESDRSVEVAKLSNEQIVLTNVLGDSSQLSTMKQLDIAANYYGESVLVWTMKNRALVASFFNGSNWSEFPLMVNPSGAASFSTAMDISGRAHIVWAGTHCDEAGPVFASSFQYSQPVSHFGNLSSSHHNAAPAIAVSEQGKAVAVWTNLSIPAIEGAYFDGQTWYAPTVIQLLDSERAINTVPFVSVDSDANALVTWNREIADVATVIESARFESFNQQWSAVSLIDTLNVDPNIRTLTNFSLNSNQLGSAVALYGNYGYPSSVGLLNGTVLSAPLPPVEVFGNYIETASGAIKVITWLPSPSDNVASYQVVRDGSLVATVCADGPLEFFDLGRQKILDTYNIRAILNDGTFSVFNFVRL